MRPGTTMAAASVLTPAMRQYLEQKRRVGDAILLFRMGDFYETFYDDAKTIARVLGLTLTARDKNSDAPIPLAGVPYHAVDRYVARLVRAGFKVAISEQLEDPKTAKGVVKRDVVRIITPGTLTDEGLLDERADNFLVALLPTADDWSAGEIGLACASLASGRFFAQMVPAGRLMDELTRLRPAEVLVPEAAIGAPSPVVESMRDALGAAVSERGRHVFDAHLAEAALCEHFQVATLSGFGFDRFDASLCAAAAVLDYLRETQKTALAHLLTITPRLTDDAVMIDQVTLRSLEVERTLREGGREGSLLAAVDATASPMGARLLREWLCYPLLDVGRIRKRQAAVTALKDETNRLERIRAILRTMGDVERVLARVGLGRASPRDVVGLGQALLACRSLAETIGPSVLESDNAAGGSDGEDLLSEIAAAARGHEALGEFLMSALKDDAPAVLRDGGFIADGYDAELDRLRAVGREGHAYLAEFQAREAQRTGIPTLKVGYNSVFGYYIEVTHQHRDRVPPDYVRKQTVRNAERYITDDLKRHENEVLGAADRARQRELELFEAIRQRVAKDLKPLQRAAEAVATLDVLASFAELARTRSYCRPEIVEETRKEEVERPKSRNACPWSDEEAKDAKTPKIRNPKSETCNSVPSCVLEVCEGRHPVLDVTLRERFVPNDCRLSEDGDRLLIITGPNMAGKSTYIRQVALLTLLAHTGSYVPAKAMRWSPVDRIFARVGANDELARGQSTFMVEMVETARILHNATSRSLVVLDEIGRGTSTYDGLAIAWAVTEHLARRVRCRTLFATHYHELTALADRLPQVANFNVAVREELRPGGTGRGVIFLHKILPGATDRSYGVHVAAMAGLPSSVVRRSETILSALECGHAGARTGPAALDSPDAAAEGGDTKPIAQVADEDQLLLFHGEPPLPAGCRAVAARLAEIDVERTTPLDALALLEELKRIAEEGSP